jgi:hypothetical protein
VSLCISSEFRLAEVVIGLIRELVMLVKLGYVMLDRLGYIRLGKVG